MPTFRAARDTLSRHREDIAAARAAFSWPDDPRFNWATDWFDTLPPDRPAVHLIGPHGTTSRTYGQLAAASRRAAGWLADQGVERGDAVLLVCGNRIELWEVLLAAMRLGVVLVPTFPTATEAEIADRVRRAGVRHAIGVEGGLPLGGWANSTREVTGVGAGGDDPLFVYFTSGTTSAPKLVPHTHRSWPVGHLSSFYWNGLVPGDVHANLAAPGWAKHAWSSFFVPFTAEATVVAFTDDVGPARVRDALDAHAVTSLCAPPTFWRTLVASGLGERPRALREATSAGEKLSADLLATVREAWGVSIRDGYGQTEATGMIGTPPGMTVRPGALGFPLPGYDIALVDAETGLPGDEGEIRVDLATRPPGLSTACRDTDGWYRTGDLGVRHADGTIECLGRVDDQFKSFDRRVSPHELEGVLRRHPLVRDAAVVPVPHPIGEWQPKAYVELVPGAAVEPAAELFALAGAELSAEKAIAVIEFVDLLPRTASGKVQRARLRGLPDRNAYRADAPSR